MLYMFSGSYRIHDLSDGEYTESWDLEEIIERMTIQRMDHVGVVVDDLGAAIAFFTELGLELDGKASVEGPWVDQVNGLDDVRADIAMMRSPDGHGRIELSQYRSPAARAGESTGGTG